MPEPTPGAPRPARGVSWPRWFAGAVVACVAGMLVSLVVGGFVVLFFGIALIAIAGGGSAHQVDLDVFRVMLVLGPLIVGGCTFGVAIALWSLPRLRMPARGPSALALGVSSAAVTLAFIATHQPGRVDYINKVPSILVYVAATCCAAGLATRVWQWRRCERVPSTGGEPGPSRVTSRT